MYTLNKLFSRCLLTISARLIRRSFVIWWDQFRVYKDTKCVGLYKDKLKVLETWCPKAMFLILVDRDNGQYRFFRTLSVRFPMDRYLKKQLRLPLSDVVEVKRDIQGLLITRIDFHSEFFGGVVVIIIYFIFIEFFLINFFLIIVRIIVD